jgi:hypothetical protein
MSNQINNSPSIAESVSYVPNPEAALLIAALIQTGYFPSSIPDCMTDYWPLALAEIQAVAEKSERERFQAFSAFTVDLPKEQSWGMMFEVRTFLLPKVNRTEKDRQLFWAKDAMSPPPKLDWVVPSLFARPSLNILVGDPGSKKTYLAMDLAVCIANGTPWLDFPVDSKSLDLVVGAQHAAPDSAADGNSMMPVRYSGQLEANPLRIGAHSQVLRSKTAPSASEGGATPPLPILAKSEILNSSSLSTSELIPVLFIDEESGYLQMWSRFNSVLHAHNSDLGAPLAYTSLAAYNLRDPDDADALIKRALSIKAGLIIIDALSDLLPSSDSNNSIQLVLFNLRRMAETCHAAVVVIHHTNREGGYRGSSSIAASVDLILHVSSAPDNTLIELRSLKARFQLPEPFCARAHFDTAADGMPRFHLTATDERPLDSISSSDPAPAYSGVALAILEFLTANPNSIRAQITAGLPTFAEGTIRNVLHQLIVDGQVKKTEASANFKSPQYTLVQPTTSFISEDINV